MSRVVVLTCWWFWSSLAIATATAADPPGDRPGGGRGLAPQVPASPAAAGAAAAPLPGEAAYRQALTELCGDSCDGRAAGTVGGERAIAWIEGRLRELGLEPALESGFRQEFAVPEPLPPGVLSTTRCSVIDGAGTAARAVVAAAFAPFPFSADGAASAPVVFVGHGLVIPELELDDYRGIDVDGRVVLMLRGGPGWRVRGAELRRYTGRMTFRAKAAEAHAHGAVAVLLVDRADAGGAALDAERVQDARGGAELPFVWLDRAAVEPWFAGGLSGAEARLDAGEGTVALAAGAAVDLEVRLSRRPPRRTANVLALVPARGENGLREVVVVGAHHDHIGHGEFGSLGHGVEIGRVHPGADDNASGVAGLLELARRCRQRGPGRRAVLFAAFGGEELGQAGSRWLLDHMPDCGTPVAMLDLNMIGRARSNGLTIYGGSTGEGLAAALQGIVAVTSPPPLRVDLRDRSSYRSDQWRFLSRRIPALLFTSGLHDQYHRPGDVPDLIEVGAALAVVDLGDTVLRQLEQGPRLEFQAERGR